ncbi:EAL domain-containing protein [Vibrio zhugei]|uniref:cyclic-guanylate-specific phosphodiesterase n=1 Tax=Vibrio zhugei TaxID=2479546 RepID=A0ABV7C6E9_9VIBR|nr:EAL domain-containing protein [Vibrio zhugei]
MVYRAHYTINQYAITHSRAISLDVDLLFENILTDYYIKLDNHRSTCQEFLLEAQQFVLANPYIRSVSQTNDKHIYCSTISLDKKVPYTLGSSDKRVSIKYIPSSPLVKNSDVFLLSLKTWKDTVKFGIDSLIIQDILYTEMNYYTPTFVVDGYQVSRSGIKKIDSLDPDGHFISNNQYLEVYYTIDDSNYTNYFLINYSYYFVFLVALSFLIGLLAYRYLIRVDWMIIAIRRGLKRDEFVPFLQPIFNGSGQLTGAEILVRWQHYKKGMIAPNDFILTAEHSGQINRIFNRLVMKLVYSLTEYQHRLPENFHIAFNICATQLIDPCLLRDCMVVQVQLKQCSLVLELTERVEVPDDQRFFDGIHELKSKGIKISLDDFGIGHSSLTYLKNIQFDLLKIDKSFVDMIDENNANDHIVANVLDLAERLRVPTVAEGIESAYQAQYLNERHVDYFQGYYFAKPMPLEQFISQYCV